MFHPWLPTWIFRALDFGPRGAGRVILWPLVGTLGSMSVSLAYVFAVLPDAPPRMHATMLLAAIILPVVIAPPLLIYLSLQNRKLAVAKERLRILADFDSLTGLCNRAAFSRQVDTYLARGSGGALLFLDVDHFKAINDRFGHDQGDDALRVIANALRLSVRQQDIVGRIGGEEFGVLLLAATLADADIIARRIRRAVCSAPFLPYGKRHRLSISAGGAVFVGSAEARELFRFADKRLYDAKRAGRDRVMLAKVPVTGIAQPLAAMVP